MEIETLGINGNILKWIDNFLQRSSQCATVDGKHSSWTHVDAGVQQGTMLVPLLFPLHINNLQNVFTSHFRLFANDFLLYKAIKSVQD